MVTRLIFINVSVFVILKVIDVIFTLFNVYAFDLITYLGVPSHIPLLLHRLWTPISYMFVHEGVIHLLFNMLWLYWFGKIFLQQFSGRSLGSLYVLGGLAGALLYVISTNTIPYPRIWEGLDDRGIGAVMAIVMGARSTSRNTDRPLFLDKSDRLHRDLRVYYDFLSLGSQPTRWSWRISGSAGLLLRYRYLRARYHRWMSAIDRVVGLFKPRAKPEACENEVKYKADVRHETDWNTTMKAGERKVDAILDKLKSRADGLSSEEKSYSMPAGNRKTRLET